MIVFAVDHLHLICKNLEEMIHFWTQGIGATFIENRTFGGAQGAVLRLDGLQINLRVPRENEHGEDLDTVPRGYDHLGLRVKNLEAACSHLASYGCTIHTGPTELSDRKIAFLKGPEDITLELMQLF